MAFTSYFQLKGRIKKSRLLKYPSNSMSIFKSKNKKFMNFILKLLSSIILILMAVCFQSCQEELTELTSETTKNFTTYTYHYKGKVYRVQANEATLIDSADSAFIIDLFQKKEVNMEVLSKDSTIIYLSDIEAVNIASQNDFINERSSSCPNLYEVTKPYRAQCFDKGDFVDVHFIGEPSGDNLVQITLQRVFPGSYSKTLYNGNILDLPYETNNNTYDCIFKFNLNNAHLMKTEGTYRIKVTSCSNGRIKYSSFFGLGDPYCF